MDKNNYQSKYICLVSESLKKIHSSYYAIETENGEKVRERAFCYELYHQMRNIQENEKKFSDISIHGEIDKRGNRSYYDRKNPDFIFHTPGCSSNNNLVVEVKVTLKNRTKDIEKDFDTLVQFINQGFYKNGLFLLVNHNLDEFKDEVCIGKYFDVKNKDKIMIFCKKGYDEKIESCIFEELFD